MNIWYNLNEALIGLAERTTALSIGTFDGVHLGHQAVISELQRQARDYALTSVILTFAQHPAALVREEIPPLLLPIARRLELLAGMGVDGVLIPPFGEELARMTPEEFVASWISGLKVRRVVVGHDFRFGAHAAGDADLLSGLGRELGVEVIQVPPVRVDGVTISSTAVRWMLAAGDIAAVNRALGRKYSINGRVIAGQSRGRRIGFPTANLQLPPGSLWPRYGVYIVETMLALEPEKRFGLANVGIKPTFGGGEPMVEIHLFDFVGDLYGREIEVSFLSFLRPEKRFKDPGELRAQIESDLTQAHAVLAGMTGECR